MSLSPSATAHPPCRGSRRAKAAAVSRQPIDDRPPAVPRQPIGDRFCWDHQICQKSAHKVLRCCPRAAPHLSHETLRRSGHHHEPGSPTRTSSGCRLWIDPGARRPRPGRSAQSDAGTVSADFSRGSTQGTPGRGHWAGHSRSTGRRPFDWASADGLGVGRWAGRSQPRLLGWAPVAAARLGVGRWAARPVAAGRLGTADGLGAGRPRQGSTTRPTQTRSVTSWFGTAKRTVPWRIVDSSAATSVTPTAIVQGSSGNGRRSAIGAARPARPAPPGHV